MPGYGDFMLPPIGCAANTAPNDSQCAAKRTAACLDALLRWEATHCARCHRPASTLVRQPGIAGQGYCEECDQAVQAQRCIERVREECGASG